MPPQSELDLIRSHPGVNVIDHELKRSLLIEAQEELVKQLRHRLSPNWLITPEVFYSRPK
jgi:hypothetical protein